MIQSTLVSLKRNAFVRKRLLKKRKNRRLFLSKRKSPTNIIVYSCTPRCVYLCLCICVCVCVCVYRVRICARSLVSSNAFYSLRFVGPSSVHLLGPLVDPPLPVPPYCSRSTENSSIARSLRAGGKAGPTEIFAGGNLKIKEKKKKKKKKYTAHVFTCHHAN